MLLSDTVQMEDLSTVQGQEEFTLVAAPSIRTDKP